MSMQDSQAKVIKIPVYRQRIANNMPLNMEKKRVCAYCRVSTEDDCQISSFDLQVEHYMNFINANKYWEFAGVYSDYGKSGTGTKKEMSLHK